MLHIGFLGFLSLVIVWCSKNNTAFLKLYLFLSSGERVVSYSSRLSLWICFLFISPGPGAARWSPKLHILFWE